MRRLVGHMDLPLFRITAFPVFLMAGPGARIGCANRRVSFIQLITQSRLPIPVSGHSIQIGQALTIIGRECIVIGIVFTIAVTLCRRIELLVRLQPRPIGLLGTEPTAHALIEQMDIIGGSCSKIEVFIVVLLPGLAAKCCFIPQILCHRRNGKVRSAAFHGPGEIEFFSSPTASQSVLRNISEKHHTIHVRTARVGVFLVIDRINRSVPQRRCISRLDIKRNASVQRVRKNIVRVGAHHTIGARRRDPSGDPALLSVVLDQSI